MQGEKLIQMLEQVATFTEGGPGVTRRFLTQEHRDLLVWLESYAEENEFLFWIDDSGNGRLHKSSGREGAKTLYIGSHQDTVREGGKYDGILGVLLPLVALEKFPTIPFNIEIIAFGDEEGTRFGSTLVGSSALAGCFDKSMLKRTDENDITMLEAMNDFGLNPNEIDAIALDKNKSLGFIEVHIEQGPVLESKNLPVGIVTDITGIERHQITITGRAGHAGTTPMELRDDALVAAAKIILIVDEVCRETENFVGVVGKLAVEPNAVNVIPGRVVLTIELRSPDSKIRRAGREKIFSKIKNHKGISIDTLYEQEGIECDKGLQAELSQAITEQSLEVTSLFSGAGHDGLAMSKRMPSAMLFMRCKDGLSHHPDEAITAKDCDVAIAVLRKCLLNMAAKHDV